jgi:hypothetical protein
VIFLFVGCGSRDFNEDTLSAAAERDDLVRVKSLVNGMSATDPRDPVVLINAAELASVEMVEFLLTSGWDVDVPATGLVLSLNGWNIRQGEGMVYPLAAAIFGTSVTVDSDVVELLAESEADPCALSTVEIRRGDEWVLATLNADALAKQLDRVKAARSVPPC